MIKSITISGDREMIIRLDEFQKDMSMLEEPLKEAGRFMQEEAMRNFPAKGKIFEETWPPLKASTKKLKAKYWPGKPMMVRTGLLKGSFRINGPVMEADGGWIEVFNPVDYASSHQEGIGRLPRRVLLKLARRQTEKIIENLTRWMKKKIDKNFKGI